MGLGFLRIALENHHDKKLAVIIKGNPEFIDDPKIEPMATALYADIKNLLEAKGYRVIYDAGEDFTMPQTNAAVWVGHSRGVSRFKFAPPTVTCVPIMAKSPAGHNRDHYVLSKEDIHRINNLPNV